MGVGFQWCGFVEEGVSEGDDFVVVNFVVVFVFFGVVFFVDYVGVVECVVQ